MKILFIAPYPPPHTGNSLPVKVLYESLKLYNEVDIINLNKSSHKSGIFSLKRILEILRIIINISINQKKYDRIYLTVSESVLGNIRDLIIYFICNHRLNSIYIHMFGGENMNNILSNKYNFLFKLNAVYLNKLGGIIVEGEKQLNMFARVAKIENIHVVYNFAEDYLHISQQELKEKFENSFPLKILFLSNLLPGKGHFELLEAYLRLDKNIQEKIHIDIAGKLIDNNDSLRLHKLLSQSGNITYHGSVKGLEKKMLFWNAHIFCLPTYYPFEGQPFSIIEAYASGCMVITTNHSGITNIFQNQINGFETKKKSVNNLYEILKQIVDKNKWLLEIGKNNAELAKKKYTEDIFIEKMTNIIVKLKIN